MYNPKFTMGENIRLFNAKVDADISTLRDRYASDPEKYAVFYNKMVDFNTALQVVALSENPEIFNDKTKEIEKYLKNELKRSRLK